MFISTAQCKPAPRVVDDIPLADLQRMLLRDDNGKPIDSEERFNVTMRAFELKEKFRKKFCFPFPHEDVVKAMVEHSPLVSVGCGTAYLEYLAVMEGADIIATDSGTQYKNCMELDTPNGHMARAGRTIEILDAAEAVEKYPDRNVFMSWPDFRNDVSQRVAEAMALGVKLLYIGETRYGCTATDEFFDIVEKWGDYEYVANTHFEGVHDGLYVYQKC